MARAFAREATTPTRRLRICEQLISGAAADPRLAELRSALKPLDVDHTHYWIGTLYTLLMEAADRRSKAAYFTPPGISKALVARLVDYGFDLSKHSVVDPAAGGAAFLSTIAGEMRSAGASAKQIIPRLAGLEIDTGLARLSESLIGHRLNRTLTPASVVRCRDSLSLRKTERYDLVVANPPYGRVARDEIAGVHWKKVCHSGHVNKFALFTELCFRLAKANGLVALVLPSSIVAGPLYDKLRSFVRTKGELLLLGTVAERDDVFVDVQQDITILVARAGKTHGVTHKVAFGTFARGRSFKALGTGPLPKGSGAAWTAPTVNAGLHQGGATLANYGATVRSGYFVWNREGARMRSRSYGALDVPLIWAENIRAGEFCVPVSSRGQGIDFVNFQDCRHLSILRGNAIVLQRTTNSSQPRRLVAARVSPSVTKTWGGFTTENHTIAIVGPDAKQLDALCILLNSAAVDKRYRRLSGTASVSVQLLRTLDLPRPKDLEDALMRYADPETAVEQAYIASAAATRSNSA